MLGFSKSQPEAQPEGQQPVTPVAKHDAVPASVERSREEDAANNRRASQVRTRAEAHADGVLRGRSTFERHIVRDALISAFISGADFDGGHAVEKPEHEQEKNQPHGDDAPKDEEVKA